MKSGARIHGLTGRGTGPQKPPTSPHHRTRAAHTVVLSAGGVQCTMHNVHHPMLVLAWGIRFYLEIPHAAARKGGGNSTLESVEMSEEK